MDDVENSPCGRLRRAVVTDADAIGRLVDAAYGHYVARIGRLPAPMAADHAAAVADHEVWVVDEAGAIVAVLELIPRSGHLFVENVAVRPDRQARGLGRRLLDFAEAEARRHGVPEIRLETNERFTENLAIYRRRGYVEVGRRPRAGTDVLELAKALELDPERQAGGTSLPPDQLTNLVHPGDANDPVDR